MDLNVDLNDKSENSNIVPDFFQLHQIAQEVAEKHDLSLKGLVGGSNRSSPVVAARNEFCYRAYIETEKTFAEIARIIGISHTSVGYAATRFALHKGLPPPRGYWPDKVAKTLRTYPKTGNEAQAAYEALLARKREQRQARAQTQPRKRVPKRKYFFKPHADSEALRVGRMHDRAKRGSNNLLTLLRKHHGPLVG